MDVAIKSVEQVATADEVAHPSFAVRLRDVGKQYSQGTVALANVNLDVRTGEFISLLGPSGCGKSTVLRTVAGLQAITSGNVEVLGGDVRAMAEHPGDLAFVFQDPTLMPWRSVLHNVALPLELMGVSKRERKARAMDMIGMVGLSEVAHQLPRQLSGGMRMRVSIARALVSKPKLLLLDEPFAALDEITRQRLQDELLRLWSALGMTVLFVTHNVFEAVYLSSRIVVMHANPGRVKAQLNVNAPYPRRRELLTSPEFAATVTSAIEELEEA